MAQEKTLYLPRKDDKLAQDIHIIILIFAIIDKWL